VRHAIGWALTATAIVVVAQLVMMTLVQITLAAPDDDGRAYRIREIPTGTQLTQTFVMRTNAFDTIRLEGSVAGTPGAGAVVARIVRLGSAEQELRRAAARISDGTCCLFQFQPVIPSAEREFRLDLSVWNLPPGTTLELASVLNREGGGLSINGRGTRADLRIRVGARDGTVRGLLERTNANRARVITALVIGITLTTGLIVFGLLRVFRSTS
jgi:hypothetical protein